MSRAANTTSEKMIKVDHVGENGAVNIYRAQKLIAKLRAPKMVSTVDAFLTHELNHRRIFRKHLKSIGVRKCVSYHVAGAGGLFLGFVTGLLGARAIAATTYAVESVVVKHLHHQLEYLAIHDEKARACVLKIIKDEQEHLDSAEAELDKNNVYTRPLIWIVRQSTEAVIAFGMR